MLFLSGTRDEFASASHLKKVCAPLPNATLTWIEGANHAFKAGKINTQEILVAETKDCISNNSRGCFEEKTIRERVWNQQNNFTANVRKCWFGLCWWTYIEKAGLKILVSGEPECKSLVFETLCS
jgi:hypothetical protein